MKKIILFLLMVFACTFLFCMEIPESLYGIWEGKDRFVFFEKQEDSQENEITIILKEYYGWYYDRTAEPEEYSKLERRTVNTGTTKKSVHVKFSVQPINSCEYEKDAFEVVLEYSSNQKSIVPVAIVDGKMYLDFFVKALDFDEEGNPVLPKSLNGFWKGNAASEGLKVSEQVSKENISGYYIADSKFYDIRYWKSDMDLSGDSASFDLNTSDDKISFNVSKHIFSAQNVYSCTSGRSKKIRNPQPGFSFNPENFVINQNKTILARDEEPYLVQLADKNTFEDMMQIVKTANSRRKPFPPDPFYPSKADFHWDLIYQLEKNHPMIQAARERQRAFRNQKSAGSGENAVTEN